MFAETKEVNLYLLIMIESIRQYRMRQMGAALNHAVIIEEDGLLCESNASCSTTA